MGIKISELPQTTQLTSDDVVPIVQSGDTKKIQAKNIITNSHNSNQTATYSSDYINNNFNKVNVQTSQTTSTTDTYSCNYIDNKIKNEYSTSTTDTYSCDYIDNKIVEGSTGYTKLPDGTLICYGVINQTTYPADEWQRHEVSLPQSYKDATYSIQLTIRHDGDGWTNIADFRADSKNNNTFNLMLHNIGSNPVKIGFSWITIGRWK